MTDFCVIGDVQALTQITYSGSTKPTSTQVSAWITEVTAYIESRTGMKYASTAVTDEYHDGDGGVFILTDYYPIIDVISLTVDDVVLVKNTDFWIKDAKGGMLECNTAPEKALEEYADGHRNIKVSYTHGFAAVPAEVKELCATITALKALSAAGLASTAGTIASYSDGDVSIKYAEGNGLVSGLLLRYEELKALVPKRTIMAVS